MDPAQLLVTILGAGGGGAAILALVNGVIKWLSGSAARERDKNTDLISQRRKAIQEREAAENDRDEEAQKRRKAEEYSSILRRQLIEAGLEPALPSEDDPLATQDRLYLPRTYGTKTDEKPPSLPTVPAIPTHPRSPYTDN